MTPHFKDGTTRVYLAQRQAKETTSEGVLKLLHEVTDNTVHLSHYPNGAPYLPSHPHLNISISHSKHFIALILGDRSQRLGIDIEEKATQAERLLERYATPAEQRLITETLSPPLLLWSSKEALYKAFSDKVTGFTEQLTVECIHQEHIKASVRFDNGDYRQVELLYHIASPPPYPYILVHLTCGY